MDHEREIIFVDLDGTLAKYTQWGGIYDIGKPIPKMIDRVKRWLDEGKEVQIFTARVGGRIPIVSKRKMVNAIQDWTEKHLGKRLPVTAEKTPEVKMIYDDRATGVKRNTGELR